MLDQLIIGFDRALRTVFAPAHTIRPVPGHDLPDMDMSDQEKRHAAALMRINHVGEVCAQALYQGQAMTSRNLDMRDTLNAAAQQEEEHLAWTEQRIAELGGRKSLLNPLWYSGAFGIGFAAGILGDDWNLGFLAETERQVEAHLSGHLDILPPGDEKSRAIVAQMKDDEVEHAEMAVRLGARELPMPIKLAMKGAAKIMTGAAYHI